MRLTLDSLAFGEALSTVLPAASRDEVRPILHAIRVEVLRGPKVQLVACDNYRIAVAPVTGEIARSGPVESFTLDLRDAQAIAKAIPKPPKYGAAPPITFDWKRDHVRVAINGWSLEVAPVEGIYPNWQGVLPKGKVAYTLTVNARLLAELVAAMGKVATPGTTAADKDGVVTLEVIRGKHPGYKLAEFDSLPYVIRPRGSEAVAYLMPVRVRP